MTEAAPDVLVIGAGVSGLSSALALLGAGLRVTVYAARPPHLTTSAVAGALWGRHLVGADERVARWADLTLGRLRELAADPVSGVTELPGTAASLDHDEPPPEFVRGAGTPVRCQPADLPPGYASGWRYTAPVVTMPSYLDYLSGQLASKGGELHLGPPLGGLPQALARSAAPVIVNCTGIGARDLVPDPALVPVRGQVVVVANPGLSEFFVGEREHPEESTYYFPHGATALLGGTEQAGNSDLRPDPVQAERIVQACALAEPRLAGAMVLAHRVGLRPVRPAVRLEAQPAGDGRFVIHNYGHGGAGVTLSWGCAQDVAEAAVRLLG